MLLTLHNAHADKAMVPPTMKAASLFRVVETMAKIMSVDFHWTEVGLRPGEKLHESVYSQWSEISEDSSSAVQYSDDELRTILEPVVHKILSEV